MSFLGFGKSKKQQSSALPAATRDIASSHGPETRVPTANGGFITPNGPNGMDRSRPNIQPSQSQSQSQSQGASVNTSLESMRGMATPLGEPVKEMRSRAESDLNGARSNSLQRTNGGPPPGADSPYPWSQRRLQFTSNISPFPRYGSAVNSTASKEGWIYMMGGLVNSQMVKGDLWMVEVGNGSMNCFPVNTTSEGPGPRVGHASLLVGNAFIVFGGDTKLEDGDLLDDTLYLLNTATKQWSRASPAGPRPAGRYGHTLNILGSKIYIFGGQVEGYFFNDLVAFDLNSLQAAGNRWEIMIPNGGDGNGPVPKPRTNHSVVTWQDKLYLFGGTDGTQWFNDVWTYDPRTNLWSELDCIGYIPAPREGHAAALVNDTMYIFGGRVQDGTDLGDLSAFRISSRRWYMFQNMGMSPSPRSGHSMTAVGKHIVVLAGEPSSAPRDPTELSWSYVLDTSKIRYPPSESGPQGQLGQIPVRKFSGEGSRIPQKAIMPGQANPQGQPGFQQQRGGAEGAVRSPEPPQSQNTSPPNGLMGPAGSRLPRNASSGPPPQQQAPQPRTNGIPPPGPNQGPRSHTPTTGAENGMYDRENMVSPGAREPQHNKLPGPNNVFPTQSTATSTTTGSRSGSVNTPSRSGSRATRQQSSIDSTGRQTPRRSEELQRSTSRDQDNRPNDSGVGSSPALSHQNDELMKELEAAKSRNAWYASELALARKSGYQPSSSGSPILDQQAAEMFEDDDKHLIEALLRMKNELSRVQGSIDTQSESTANRIAEIEKQRDMAVSEAAYAKAKLAAHGGRSQTGTPQPDLGRGTTSPDMDRVADVNKRLAAALTAHNELNAKMENVMAELQTERRARHLAEDTADAAHERATELDLYKQRTASELESLRAELHEAQRVAREEAANCAEALSSSRMLEVDKNELFEKHSRAMSDNKNHSNVLQTLREAVNASMEKANLLERKLEEERNQRTASEQKLAQLKAAHEERTAELESTSRKLVDAEEFAEKHAEEARTHREAVLSGLGQISERHVDENSHTDERVKVLQQQLESATVMVRKNKDAADSAADRLRRAEERIAGLEAYQEQTTRESLALRKQLQTAMKDVQAAHAERSSTQQQLERNMLEGNALEVQLKTLKNLLEERGISAADRRSRVLESPSSRYGTPEMGRVRDLERQLDESIKAHDEMRTTFEQREQEVSREWEDKLAALDNDHQGAVKYVRGLEKMLAKMKQELQRTKSVNQKLEEENSQHKASARDMQEPSHWEAERESLRAEIAEAQESVRITIGALESQINTLKNTLAQAEHDRETMRQTSQQSQHEHEQAVNQIADRARAELEALRSENSILEARATDAENKVQLFLDQFENSVDNYRRMSRIDPSSDSHTAGGANGHSLGGGQGHTRNNDSIGGDSMYSAMTDTEDLDDDNVSQTSGELTPSAHSFPTAGMAGSISSPAAARGHERDRSSTALDSLATELDALRSHWEETNKKNYRLSDKFESERSPNMGREGKSSGHGEGVGMGGGMNLGNAGGGGGVPDWSRQLDESDKGKENEIPAGLQMRRVDGGGVSPVFGGGGKGM
ncbi:hypothetical protein EJ08DRAFT_104737 [Tothia fuscella]|uniref:Cell polarity protein n=1 Tax=Tothia fuscella TaxID=1048955 RepID=A0A9P4NWM1_9PEZI|nr:hypothetical protein EJ08DRAFT_104737 [Tothia fuscella]